MDILETSIQKAGSVNALAQDLGVRQNVVSNWRARGLPKPWHLVLTLKYGNPTSPSAPRSSVAIENEAKDAM